MTASITLFRDRVELVVEGHVAEVRLNRPDKLNALDPAMFAALADAAEAVRALPAVRCVVLCANGPAFCAGLDLAAMAQLGGAKPKSLIERTHGNCNYVQHAAMVWRDLPVPVICAIQGVCFGGGLQVASGADIRIVAPDARMAVMELRWGLVPDMGGNVLWRDCVRHDLLRELIYTHREFTGTEAVHYGFATHLADDPLSHARAMAEEIASKSPQAIRAAKALSNSWNSAGEDELLLAESRAQQELIGSANQREAVAAGLQKRPAKFTDV